MPPHVKYVSDRGIYLVQDGVVWKSVKVHKHVQHIYDTITANPDKEYKIIDFVADPFVYQDVSIVLNQMQKGGIIKQTRRHEGRKFFAFYSAKEKPNACD